MTSFSKHIVRPWASASVAIWCAVGSAILLAACSHDKTAEAGGAADSGASEAPKSGGEERAPSPVVNAHTAVATIQPFSEVVTALGVVAPRPGHYAELAAPAPTRVLHVFVAAGDAVAEGAPLVEFDRAVFDAAAGSADAALVVAEHANERAQRLAAAGIIARKDVDQAAADLAQAKNTDIVARRAQELSTLRAPLAGVVTHISAVLGATVDPSQSLVGVADPNALDVVLSLSPADGARVSTGDPVTVTAGQSAAGEPLGTGVVTAVGVALDSNTRTLAVRAHLARPARAIRIGETVFGGITVSVRRRAVTVPVEALVPEGDGLKVFVVEKGGLARAQAVTVGGRTETVAEITQGLTGGETIVTQGAFGVEDSARVVPVK
jgi:RND family efflux transporter MFP subunit